ncbi:glutamate receptor ionotropic, NMDA 2B-like [Babylonia areolata]|uniref:glutamate receptor ionotropic, NMDA 2B-like n=1 Tax=Babylonia areolata TaxID=304850 RepID=UPI003FD29EDE
MTCSKTCDGLNSRVDRHGQWDGLIRELLDGRADMAVTSLRISEDRARAVSFSEPYLETGITIIVAIREGAISATAFLEPYDYPSWCLILVFSVHTVGASIFVCEWLSPYGMDRGRVRLTEHRFSLFRTFWLMWAMLFGAAVSTNSPRGVSSKFLANIWALFALVFLASYTANLAAFMITKEEYFDLSGIQDWRLQNPQWMKPSFKYGTIPNTSTESNIRKNNRDMYLYMQQYNQQSVQEAIYNLKIQQLHAFIYDATVLEYQAGRDADCRLITVGNWYAMSGYGIAFPVGSPWKQRVNSIILDLQTKGEMERLQEFWLAGACHMKQKKTQNQRGITGGVSSSTLGILNFTSAFILLGAGTGLATLTFLLEYCLFWFGRRRLSTWDKKDCCTLISMSMGLSLSFQQSVHDALQLHKSHRCRNPVCESQLWKANHRLDMARLEIDKLQKEIAALAVEKEAKAAAAAAAGATEVWKYDPARVRPQGATASASPRGNNSSNSRNNSPNRPGFDVYINDNQEDPVCPKVTLL